MNFGNIVINYILLFLERKKVLWL